MDTATATSPTSKTPKYKVLRQQVEHVLHETNHRLESIANNSRESDRYNRWCLGGSCGAATVLECHRLTFIPNEQEATIEVAKSLIKHHRDLLNVRRLLTHFECLPPLVCQILEDNAVWNDGCLRLSYMAVDGVLQTAMKAWKYTVGHIKSMRYKLMTVEVRVDQDGFFTVSDVQEALDWVKAINTLLAAHIVDMEMLIELGKEARALTEKI